MLGRDFEVTAGPTWEMPNPGNAARVERKPYPHMPWLKSAWCRKASVLGLQEKNTCLVRLLADARSVGREELVLVTQVIP